MVMNGGGEDGGRAKRRSNSTDVAYAIIKRVYRSSLVQRDMDYRVNL
jgi:hypothetical protein